MFKQFLVSSLLLLGYYSLVYADSDLLKHTFTSQKYRYSIQYPNQWRPHDEGSGVVVFKDLPGKEAYTLVNIQTIYTKKAGGHYATVKDLMDDFISQVPKHTAGVKFFKRTTISLPQDQDEQGESVSLIFNENGHQLKHWQVMFLSKDGRFFQAWGYRAPVSSYEVNYPLAKAMLESWVIG